MSSCNVLFSIAVLSKGKKRGFLVLNRDLCYIFFMENLLKVGLAVFMKLSVISPNTMHMRGITVPLIMAITVPLMSSTTSQRSANLN